jgi:hypothetical protein
MGNRGKGCCSSILGGDGGVEKKTGSGRTRAPSSQRHGRGELLGEGCTCPPREPRGGVSGCYGDEHGHQRKSAMGLRKGMPWEQGFLRKRTKPAHGVGEET